MSEPTRTKAGKWAPGSSGNPSGRPRRCVEIEDDIREKWGPKADLVVARLYTLALRGNVVAGKEFLDRVIGKPRIRPDDRAPVEVDIESRAATIREEIRAIIVRDVASIAAVADKRGLTVDEARAVCDYMRALDKSADEELGDMPEEEMITLAESYIKRRKGGR